MVRHNELMKTKAAVIFFALGFFLLVVTYPANNLNWSHWYAERWFFEALLGGVGGVSALLFFFSFLCDREH